MLAGLAATSQRPTLQSKGGNTSGPLAAYVMVRVRSGTRGCDVIATMARRCSSRILEERELIKVMTLSSEYQQDHAELDPPAFALPCQLETAAADGFEVLEVRAAPRFPPPRLTPLILRQPKAIEVHA